jgi:hypothetical protein
MALEAARAVDAGAIAAACTTPGEIAERVRAARVAAVKKRLEQAGDQD